MQAVQDLADTALIFIFMWILMTFAVIILWALFDGVNQLLDFLDDTLGESLKSALLLLAFSAMLAALTTYAYLYDA